MGVGFLGGVGGTEKPARNRHEPTYPPLEMENTTGGNKAHQVFTSEALHFKPQLKCTEIQLKLRWLLEKQ